MGLAVKMLPSSAWPERMKESIRADRLARVKQRAAHPSYNPLGLETGSTWAIRLAKAKRGILPRQGQSLGWRRFETKEKPHS